MRIGYYILRKGKLLFSQDSTEVLNFFKDLLENDMIEFPVEEKVKPLNYIEFPYTEGLKKEARERGLTIPQYIQFLLENSKEGWRHKAAIFAKKYFYNNKFQPKLKAPWIFTEKPKQYYWSHGIISENRLNKDKGIINIMSFEEFLNINKKHFELQENRPIEKKIFIKEKLKKEKFSLDWFLPLLEENTIIKGFKITDKPYTNVHQNLFQDKVKFSSQEFPCFPNQFILEQTNCKSDKLYLCKLRTLNPNKFRLVLKTHKENIIVGVLPLNLSIDGKKVNYKTEISIPSSEYEIGHLKININEEGVKQTKVLSDFDLNYLSNRGSVKITKECRIGVDQLNKRVKLIKNAKNEKIRVTLESYIRVILRNKFFSFGNSLLYDGGLPSIIGQSIAKEFKKLRVGKFKNVSHYFGEILDFSFFDKDFKKSEKRQNINHYLGTYVSKKGNLFVKVLSANYDDFINYNYKGGNSNMFWQNFAERGWTLDRIKKDMYPLKDPFGGNQDDDYFDWQNDDYDPYGDTDLGNPNGWW